MRKTHSLMSCRNSGAQIACALFGAAAALSLVAGAAIANDQAESLGRFKQWNAYKYQENGDPVCFIAAKPEKSSLSKKGRDRGDVYFLITHWSNQGKKGEPSVVIGYPLQENSTVDVEIGDEKFSFITSGDGAWLEDERDEHRLVDAMRKGVNMEVTGVSTRGTKSFDVFSLLGVTAAISKIDGACS